MEKFNNKYRIPSARLQNYDYGANGAYFITICTSHRNHYFGEIVETRLIASPHPSQPRLIASPHPSQPRLIASPHPSQPRFIASDLGQLAHQYWSEISKQFPFVELGNFVIMPNHVHGILIIDKNANVLMNDVTANDVETRLIASLQSQTNKRGGFAGNKNPMFHENVSRIIRWYKGRCTFEMRKIHNDFAWQSGFYDHIIRDDTSFNKITEYIIMNPEKWQDDKFYCE